VRPGDYVIGCHAEAEINIVADGVAERHAQLTVNYHELFIEDLGSDSGTFVGGKRVTESTRLWPSQKVQIGSVVIETRKVKSVADSESRSRRTRPRCGACCRRSFCARANTRSAG
jgi:pSer/pThr/pTyr-binding forkhead associated (FHA) protein